MESNWRNYKGELDKEQLIKCFVSNPAQTNNRRSGLNIKQGTFGIGHNLHFDPPLLFGEGKTKFEKYRFVSCLSSC